MSGTVSEIDHAGFNIYRSADGEEYEKVNTDLIAGKGSVMEGVWYE